MIAAIFVAQYNGVALAPTCHLLIVAVSVSALVMTATAGLVGAVEMLTLMLTTLSLPLEGGGLH